MGQALARLWEGVSGGGGGGAGAGGSGGGVGAVYIMRGRKLAVVRHLADGGFSAVFHVRDNGTLREGRGEGGGGRKGRKKRVGSVRVRRWQSGL
jgi:hypothetical protein